MSDVVLSEDQWVQVLGLDPDVANLAVALVYWLTFFGGRARVAEGRRTPERQRWLYASGRTRPGPILTHTQLSRHEQGRAFDIDFVGFRASKVNPAWWDFAGRIGEALGLRWGGRFTRLRDFRHFEL